MEIKGKVHCFFEQSGTFKNEFIKLGIPAEDYDIQNNFGETDDLFEARAERISYLSNKWLKEGMPIKQPRKLKHRQQLVSLRIDRHTCIMVPPEKATEQYAAQYREKLRKDFKVNSTQHAYMVERTLAKENYQKKCKAIRVDEAGQDAVVKQMYEAELRNYIATLPKEEVELERQMN